MEKLRILRKKQGYTQQDIANFLSLPRSTYRNYEAGIASPSIETLASLADFYNLSLDELLGRVPEQQLFDDSRIDRPEVLELFEQLTPHQQALILERMYAYIEVNEEAPSSGQRDTYTIVPTGRYKQQ